HEGEQLGGGHAGGEDDVALVLPVLVVHDQHRAARRDVLDRAVDVVEQLIHLSPSAMSIRSTYLAITSTSRFTTSPGCRVPSVVRFSVSGIRQTSNHPSAVLSFGPGGVSAETVRLIPSTAMEPFSTTYRAIPSGRVMRTWSQCSAGVREMIVAVASTCPCTRCPPIRSARRTERSRLTGSPAV